MAGREGTDLRQRGESRRLPSDEACSDRPSDTSTRRKLARRRVGAARRAGLQCRSAPAVLTHPCGRLDRVLQRVLQAAEAIHSQRLHALALALLLPAVAARSRPTRRRAARAWMAAADGPVAVRPAPLPRPPARPDPRSEHHVLDLRGLQSRAGPVRAALSWTQQICPLVQLPDRKST